MDSCFALFLKNFLFLTKYCDRNGKKQETIMLKSEKILFIICVGFIGGVFLYSAIQNPENIPKKEASAPADAILKQGELSALEWLKLMDRGQFQEAWNSASPLFKEIISSSQWVKYGQVNREQLGTIISRSIVEEKPTENPKGLPPGEYMYIKFKSVFSKRPEAEELITLKRESNGQWKVFTYAAG